MTIELLRPASSMPSDLSEQASRQTRELASEHSTTREIGQDDWPGWISASPRRALERSTSEQNADSRVVLGRNSASGNSLGDNDKASS
ncbi:uncharacterized protein UDID_05952 [Ustilago sp. UG-2017a]|nr:uncharacterized protein UDID_05952 [Ustilago sp. UG-2017a]